MQKWKKLGLIYNKRKYAAVPVAYFLSNDIIRIYFSSRDKFNQSVPFFIDFDLKNSQILNEQAIDVQLGQKGTFDEQGIMPTSILKNKNTLFLYYIGWNLGKTVPFRNSIGLLISWDNGNTFQKYSEGPILDRSEHDICFVASNCVYSEENFYRMYYLSCDKWEMKSNNVFQHYYKIKYAESSDGINWIRNGKIIIDYRYENEYAISAPRVLKDGNLYKMWYSYRAGPKGNTYRIGYAESNDGLYWIRKDEKINLDVSEKGWDSDMICYPFIFNYNNNRYMLYNGNGYGKSGFGLAILKAY